MGLGPHLCIRRSAQRHGSSIVEYALLVALIGLGLLPALRSLANAIAQPYLAVGARLQMLNQQPTPPPPMPPAAVAIPSLPAAKPAVAHTAQLPTVATVAVDLAISLLLFGVLAALVAAGWLSMIMHYGSKSQEPNLAFRSPVMAVKRRAA